MPPRVHLLIVADASDGAEVGLTEGLKRRFFDYGPGWIRTNDLGIKSPLLCQLSYRPRAE